MQVKHVLDPGKPGVRSMGPLRHISERGFADLTDMTDEDTNPTRLSRTSATVNSQAVFQCRRHYLKYADVYFDHNLHPNIVLFSLTMDRKSVGGFPVNSHTVPVEKVQRICVALKLKEATPVEQSNPPARRKAQS